MAARNAVAVSFLLNGLAFATWASRIPEVRRSLDLTNSELGLLLLSAAAGSVLTLPSTGFLVNRIGTRAVVAGGVFCDAIGLLCVALGVAGLSSVAVTASGLFVMGLGMGAWDVAMNIEGATVERKMARTVMPRFHAAFSLGTVLGALGGVALIALEVALWAHLGAVALLVAAVGVGSVGSFLPPQGSPAPTSDRAVAMKSADKDEVRGLGQAECIAPAKLGTRAAWRERRTLLLGVMVLALAVTEGTANDWLAVALIDGYDVTSTQAVAGFAVFVTSMTVGRAFGGGFLDRFGRTRVLWVTIAAAQVGVVLIVFAPNLPLVVAGIVLWGLGASLGFPVGISAAADDPRHAAVRVSVVSTIAYTSFLLGPPALGYLADWVGTLNALLAVAALLVPAVLLVPNANQPKTADDDVLGSPADTSNAP